MAILIVHSSRSHRILNVNTRSHVSRLGPRPRLIHVTADLFSRSNSDLEQLTEVMKEAIRGRRVAGFFFKNDFHPDWWRVLQGGVEVRTDTSPPGHVLRS